jgi:hypothetical protein
MKLTKDETNNKRFTLETYGLSNSMKLDLAAINALLILPKQNEALRLIFNKK